MNVRGTQIGHRLVGTLVNNQLKEIIGLLEAGAVGIKFICSILFLFFHLILYAIKI